MKRTLFFVAIAILVCFSSFSQASSLTIDCQTPGWLSSYIGPSNIPTLRNLKVTGTINETDLNTIGNLVKNYSLQGRLDLEDVNIVENRLSYQMFGVTDCSLQYFSLPKSIDGENLDQCISWVSLDTLVIGDSQTIINSSNHHYSYNFNSFHVKCILVREGATSIGFGAGGSWSPSGYDYDYNVKEIILPQSLERIECVSDFRTLRKMNIPENIKMLGSLSGTTYYNNSDTLFVPLSVTEFHDNWAAPDGYYGCQGNDGSYHPGRIKCVYLPERLEHLWINCLYHGNVIIHIRANIPPQIHNVGNDWSENCIIYVPYGCKDAYSNWNNVFEEVLAESIDIELPSSIHKGDSLPMTVTFTPENTTFKDVLWSSSEPSILTISPQGVLKAHEFGLAQITAKTADRSCSVTKEVQVYEHTTGVVIDNQSLTINIGESMNLFANTLPVGQSDNQVMWSSSNENIATVDDNGIVKAIKQGNCIITAESVDGGYTAQCMVTVKQPVVGVIMEKHSLALNVGQSEMLFATASPVNADNKKLIWSTTDSEIASVDADGNVTALKRGIAFIKATSEDNPLAVDSCKVTVSQPVTGITLNHNDCVLHKIGDTVKLIATVIPEDASNKEVIWASSNQSICIVSNGTVVAVGFGTCVIIATTVDGNFIATCTVTVNEDADLPGDVNHDGEVSIADINIIIDIILGRTVDDQTFERADVNGDGEVNIADINAVINLILS